MRISILFSLLFLFSTCKYEDIKPTSDCIQFEDSPFGPEITIADTTYHSPCFNPNNANEIIYIRSTKQKIELRKCNLQTKEDIYLTDAWVLNLPRWNKNGWIVFDYNYNIYKIKDNGDSLIRLTYEGESYCPDWHPNGEKLIFARVDRSPWPNLMIIDKYGKILNILDFSQGSPKPYWSPDGKTIAIKSYGGIGYIDPDTHKFYNVKQSDNEFDYGMSWFPNSITLALVSEEGLFIGDFKNAQINLLKTSCYSHKYWRPSVSPDGTKILVERDDIRKTGPSSGY